MHAASVVASDNIAQTCRISFVRGSGWFRGNSHPRRFRWLVIAFFVCLCAPRLLAQKDSTWVGGSGNWSNPLNWTDGVANGDYNATINQGSTPSTVTLDMNAGITNLSLDPNSSNCCEIPFGIDALNIAPGEALTVAQEFRNRGTIQINSGSSLSLESYQTMENEGVIEVNNGGTLTLSAPPGLQGIAGDPGRIELNSTGDLTTLRLDGNNAIFNPAASPVVTLSDNPNNLITGVTGTETLGAFGTWMGSGSITNLYLYISGPGGEVIADGTNPLIITPNGQGVTVGDGSSLDVASGSTLIVNGLVTNTVAGIISVKAEGTMIVNGTVINSGVGLSQVAGVTVGSGGHLTTGDVTNNSGPHEGGTVSLAGGTMTVNGMFTNTSSGTTSNSSLSLSAGSTMSITGDLNNAGAVALNGSNLLNVDGNMTNSGSIALASADTLRVGGTFTNQSTGNLSLATNGGTATVGQFANAGNVQVGSGANLVVASTQSFTSTGGTVTVDGTLISPGGVNIRGGTLAGSGLIAGNVTNAGTLVSGDPTGTLTIFGNYTQTATGVLDDIIDGGSPGEFGLTQVTGLVDLDGMLSLNFASGFTPFFNESFIIMTFGSFEGTFSTVNGLDLGDGFSFDLYYDPHDIRLVAEPGPVKASEQPGLLILLADLSGLFTFVCSSKKLRVVLQYRTEELCMR